MQEGDQLAALAAMMKTRRKSLRQSLHPELHLDPSSGRRLTDGTETYWFRLGRTSNGPASGKRANRVQQDPSRRHRTILVNNALPGWRCGASPLHLASDGEAVILQLSICLVLLPRLLRDRLSRPPHCFAHDASIVVAGRQKTTGSALPETLEAKPHRKEKSRLL